MEASSRRIVLELKSQTMCQCQICSNPSIMWHKENHESSCVNVKSNPLETSGYKLAIFAGDAQPWIEMPSGFSRDAKQTASSSTKVWPISKRADKERSQSNRRKRGAALTIRQVGADN